VSSSNGNCKAPGIVGTYSGGTMSDSLYGWSQPYQFVLSVVSSGSGCVLEMQFSSSSTDGSNRNYKFTHYLNFITQADASDSADSMLILDTYSQSSSTNPIYEPIVFQNLNGGAALQFEPHLAFGSGNTFDPTQSFIDILDCGSPESTTCTAQDTELSSNGTLVRSN
jgi:hypothetical protein